MNHKVHMDKWEGSRLDLTDAKSILELKLLFDAFICWQDYSLRQSGVFFIHFALTCSVHHHHFGVFLPQEGTKICAPLAELPLPQP